MLTTHDSGRILVSLLFALALLGCSASDPGSKRSDADSEPARPEREAGAVDQREREGEGDARDELPDAHADDAAPSVEEPEADPGYVPVEGACGLAKPAFCDSFERVVKSGGRSGELDPSRWSVTRGGPWEHPDLVQAFPIGPAKLPTCRADLTGRMLPPNDTVICDPTPSASTRHLLTATAAQNYGLNSYRIRQPFDFAGRTGTIKLDVDLSNNGLGGWPALVIAQEPSPAPSFDWEERGSGPRNGISVEFSGGWCNHPSTLEVGLFTFKDYVQTAQRASFDCETPHVSTRRDALNHVEIYLSQKHIELWASDPSPNGVDFPNLQKLLAADLALPFERGYVHLIVRNHATMKYWVGSAWSVRWDNVGFDGPIARGLREVSALDSLTPTQGLEGCMVGGACRWRGDVIADFPNEDKRCPPEASCKFMGEGRHVGYVVPNADEEPVSIAIPDVDLTGVVSARLALAATYPWFDWNGVSKPPTALTLRFRLNGGPWHARPIDAIEASAFTDFSPELGGAGHGAGLLNQIIELDPKELRDGSNNLELLSAGTWTGAYRVGVAAADLLLGTR